MNIDVSQFSEGQQFALVMTCLSFAFALAITALCGTIKALREVLLTRARASVARSMLQQGISPREIEMILRSVSAQSGDCRHDADELSSIPPAKFSPANTA